MRNNLLTPFTLSEGAEMGDLARLVLPVMNIDEFRSKMGDDKDVIVVGFTVMGKAPATDLSNFFEKSYDWILDADVSSGETSDGNFCVFAEMQRSKEAISQILSMLTDMMNLTSQKVEDWSFTYLNHPKKIPVSRENLEATVITSPQEYEIKTSNHMNEAVALNNLRAAAGVKTIPLGIVNPQILSMQRAAGVK